MGNQVNNNLNPQLDAFLQDVAQGIWGDGKLTYTDIVEYSKKATEQDVEVLEEFFWDWNSKLTEEDEIDVEALEEHIYEVIKGV
jgi:hypothetical protein